MVVRVIILLSLLAALVAGFAMTSVNAEDDQSTDDDNGPCSVADAYLSANLIDDAKKEYGKLLSDNKPTPGCVKTGLDKIRAKQGAIKDKEALTSLKRARAYAAAGVFEEAVKAFEAALDSDSTREQASYGLACVRAVEPETGYAGIQRLAEFGPYPDACSKLVSAIDGVPAIKEEADESAIEKDDIVASDPDPKAQTSFSQKVIDYWRIARQKFIDYWRSARRTIIDYWQPVYESVVTAIVFGIVVWLIFRRLASPLLNVRDFTVEESLKVNGESVSAMFQAAYQDTGRRGRDSATRIMGPIQSIDMPTLNLPSTPLPFTWIQSITQYLAKIFPRRVLELHGDVHRSTSRGLGLTVRLTTIKAQLKSVTIWDEEFQGQSCKFDLNDTAVIQQLAEYTAVWLMFTMQRGIGRWGRLSRRLKFKKLVELLGTEYWRSYAHFRAGLSAERRGDNDSARELYMKSLREDRRLAAARINLAMLARGDETHYKYALKLLERAISDSFFEETAVGSDGKPIIKKPPDHQSYYSGLYSLASLAYDEEQDAYALSRAKTLVKMIDARMKRIDTRWRLFDRSAELRRYLDYMLPASEALLGGLLVVNNQFECGLKKIEAMSEESKALPRLQYNLACCYSLLAEKASSDEHKKRRDEFLNCSIEYLKSSNWLNPDISKKARNDRSLSFVSKEKKMEFDAIIRPLPVPGAPKPLVLANLESIGQTHAKALAEEKIKDEDTLAIATMTWQARKDLADRLGVGTNLVRQWADAMELSTIPNIDLSEVSLLNRALVFSVADLSVYDPNALETVLADWSKSLNLTPPPNQEEIIRWINEAKRLAANPRVQP